MPVRARARVCVCPCIMCVCVLIFSRTTAIYAVHIHIIIQLYSRVFEAFGMAVEALMVVGCARGGCMCMCLWEAVCARGNNQGNFLNNICSLLSSALHFMLQHTLSHHACVCRYMCDNSGVGHDTHISNRRTRTHSTIWPSDRKQTTMLLFSIPIGKCLWYGSPFSIVAKSICGRSGTCRL